MSRAFHSDKAEAAAREHFPVGRRIRAVRRGGEPFEGQEAEVVSLANCRVTVKSLFRGRTVYSYLGERELLDVRVRDYGFELWIDGSPSFGYEVVPEHDYVLPPTLAEQHAAKTAMLKGLQRLTPYAVRAEIRTESKAVGIELVCRASTVDRYGAELEALGWRHCAADGEGGEWVRWRLPA